MTVPFNDWIEALEEDVIEGDYGYEPGEFTVYPEHWRPAWRAGKTPAEAFKSALDAFSDARRQDDAERERNWQRIQVEDRAAIAAYRSSQATGDAQRKSEGE